MGPLQSGSGESSGWANHDYIGTEHVLLGLLHEGQGVAAKSLENLGISLDAVREQVQEIIGQGPLAPSGGRQGDEGRPTGHISFTPRAMKVLELSQREALQLGHAHVGTEHILLGLICEGESTAAQVPINFGGDLTRARQQVVQLSKEPALGSP